MLERAGEAAIWRHACSMEAIKGYCDINDVIKAHPGEEELMDDAT